MGVNVMECIKCGREIVPGDVFCTTCLEDMEKYPVKPGTPVHIPRREPRIIVERRAKITPEMQMEALKRRNRILSILLALSLCAIALLVIFGDLFRQDVSEDVAKGQNYSAVQSESTEATD